MKYWVLVAIGFLLGGLTAALAADNITTWSTGEFLSSGGLNANFDHIHRLMVGGHGARLVDGDVSADAGIEMRKTNLGPLVPTIAAQVGDGTACAASTCTVTWQAPASAVTVTRASAGRYTVTFATARASATRYAVVLRANGDTVGQWYLGLPHCAVTNQYDGYFDVTCQVYDAADYPTFFILPYDVMFSFELFEQP